MLYFNLNKENDLIIIIIKKYIKKFERVSFYLKANIVSDYQTN